MHGIVFCDCIFRDVRLRFEYKVAPIPRVCFTLQCALSPTAWHGCTTDVGSHRIGTILLAAVPASGKTLVIITLRVNRYFSRELRSEATFVTIYRRKMLVLSLTNDNSKNLDKYSLAIETR